MDQQSFEQVVLALVVRMRDMDRELEAHRKVFSTIEDLVIYPPVKRELEVVRNSPELTKAIDEKYAIYFSRLMSVVRGDPDRELRTLVEQQLHENPGQD